MGGEFRYVYDNGYDAFGARPTVDFTAFGNFGIPIVNCSGACANDETSRPWPRLCWECPASNPKPNSSTRAGQRTATDFREFVQHEYGFFLQDSWKVRNNLTLELGCATSSTEFPLNATAICPIS